MRVLAMVALVVTALFFAFTGASLAAERTVVVQADLTVPILGTNAVGVLTVVYDDVSGEGDWAFDGTIDGQPASATGRGSAVIQSPSAGDDAQFELTMTEIDEWEMPGIDAATPRTATIRSAGGLAWVSYQGPVYSLLEIPVAVDPPIAFPIEGVYTLTSSGPDDGVSEIPNTGVGPADSASPLVGVFALAGLTVCAVLLASVVLLGNRSLVPRSIRARSLRQPRDDVD